MRVPATVLMAIAYPSQHFALFENLARLLSFNRARRQVAEQRIEFLAVEFMLGDDRVAVVARFWVVGEKYDLAFPESMHRLAHRGGNIDPHVHVSESAKQLGHVHAGALFVILADAVVALAHPLFVVAFGEVKDVVDGRQEDDWKERKFFEFNRRSFHRLEYRPLPRFLLLLGAVPRDHKRQVSVFGKGSQQIDVYVFPLELSFFPTTALPLNIFEPRYIQMMTDALASEHPVALSFEDPNQPSSSKAQVVGFGIPTLLEKRTNGTLLILLRGVARAQLGRQLQDKPYLVYRAQVLEDENQVLEPNRFRMRRYENALKKWIQQQVPGKVERDSLLATLNSDQKIIEFVSMHMVRDPDLRQQLLEADDINIRINLLQRMGIESEVGDHIS